MRYIDLYDGSVPLGRFDVPEYIRGSSHFFRLRYAALGGGNGVVFTANRMRNLGVLGEECAIKLLRQMSRPRQDRFQNEIRVLKDLESEFISKFFDAGHIEVHASSGGSAKQHIPWVAIQLGGPNMRQHVQDIGPLAVPELQSVMRGVCTAVSHLHDKGYIHRDIKPDNFVWRDDRRDSLLMIDFGIAKKFGEDVSARPMDTFTRLNEFVGPVFFSSPELIEYARDKEHPVSYRSDIFQVGKLLWFLGTGKTAAGIPSRRECPAGGKLRDLVMSMIDDDPDARPQSVAEIQTAVDAL
jgi:eukaryotic-like serine/threonine-protein kinase